MMRVIELEESGRLWLPAAALRQDQAAELQARFAPQIDVQWQIGAPGGWWLAGRGWVGTLRCGDLRIVLRPKTPIANLAQMLALAYDLLPEIVDALRACAGVSELADRLAACLADGVLLRARRGLYRAYRAHDDRLPYLRGRLRVRDLTPTVANLPVSYKTLTADLLPNQVLTWTLHLLLRNADLSVPTADRVRRAARALDGRVTCRPLPPDWATQLQYDRLSEPYRPLHALCRLLLDRLGPANGFGTDSALPFLIDMAALFERAVAVWLRRHLPPAYRLLVQEHSSLADGRVRIVADLVIVERAGGRVHSVLDTKYKVGARPTNEDVYQIAFYANAYHSPRALLIYPAAPAEPLDVRLDAVWLRTLPFDLAADLTTAGHALLAQLFAPAESTTPSRSLP